MPAPPLILETTHMRLQLEDLPADDAEGLEHAVTELKAAIGDAQQGLVGGLEAPVHPDDARGPHRPRPEGASFGTHLRTWLLRAELLEARVAHLGPRRIGVSVGPKRLRSRLGDKAILVMGHLAL